MLPHDLLLDFARQAAKVIDPSSGPAQAASQQLQVLAQRVLSDMNLVTRAEFDAQSAVLQRTRERLQSLENEIEQLRRQLDGVQ